MGRKRRRLVVTITETWTFVFDAEGGVDVSASAERPALAPTPAPPLDGAADAAASGSTAELSLPDIDEPQEGCDPGDDAESNSQ